MNGRVWTKYSGFMEVLLNQWFKKEKLVSGGHGIVNRIGSSNESEQPIGLYYYGYIIKGYIIMLITA